ncbi:MAG: histidine kinase dimerization/phospho-acceptor domain-containing protein, partial [Gammaproteobacteria bacterium]
DHGSRALPQHRLKRKSRHAEAANPGRAPHHPQRRRPADISLENAELYARLGNARDDYRTLWESATEGLFRMTVPGGLVRANPAFARILGFANVTDVLTEYADLPSRLFVSSNDARSFISKIGHGGTVQGFEAQCVRADGSPVWISITAQPRYDVDGKATHVDASLVDVSERKGREQAERERNAAEAAAKAKSDFLAHMSHEIRTPMNAIVGFTRLALDGELSDEQRAYLESIDGASRTLLAIINDILDTRGSRPASSPWNRFRFASMR